MSQFISFKKPPQEVFEGRKIMTDPGVHKEVEKLVLKDVAPGSNILEIGAGEGAFSLRLQKKGYNVSAVDIDEKIFNVPRVHFRKVDPSISLSEYFPENTFQAIVAIEVIEHFQSTWKFFQDMSDVLPSGGRLFLTTPNICSFYSRIVFLKEGRFHHFQGKDSWLMGHINPSPFFVIENVASDTGFKLIQRKGIGHMPILNWANFRIRNIFTAIPRIFLYFLMKDPGPKDGNILLYSYQKE